MASMVILVFVNANSENQIWYKEVIKALSDIRSQTLSGVGDHHTHTPSNSQFHYKYKE